MTELDVGHLKTALGDSLTRETSGALLRGSIRLIPQRLPADISAVLLTDGSPGSSPTCTWNRSGFNTSPFRKTSLASVDELSLSLMASPTPASYHAAPLLDQQAPSPFQIQHPAASSSAPDADGAPPAPRSPMGIPSPSNNLSPTRLHPGSGLLPPRASLVSDIDGAAPASFPAGPFSPNSSPLRTRLGDPSCASLSNTCPAYAPRNGSMSPARTRPHALGGSPLQAGLRGGSSSSSALPLGPSAGGASAGAGVASRMSDTGGAIGVGAGAGDSVDALRTQFDRQVHRPPTPLAVPGHVQQLVSRHFSTSRRVSRFALTHDDPGSAAGLRGHSIDGGPNLDLPAYPGLLDPPPSEMGPPRKSLPCGLLGMDKGGKSCGREDAEMGEGGSAAEAAGLHVAQPQDALSSFMKGFAA